MKEPKATPKITQGDEPEKATPGQEPEKITPGEEPGVRRRALRDATICLAFGAGKGARQQGYLDGQMLIAMPSLRDDLFARTLIYICAHSSEGAMGIVVNQPASNIKFPDLLVQLDVISESTRIELPPSACAMRVFKGGPVDPNRGFVLHSGDFVIESTLRIDDGICLTTTLEVLKAIANGDGPGKALMALGYAGWAAGQLETEIQGNGWLHCGADPDLVFGPDIGSKYDRALRKLGIHVGMLSSEAGHA